MFICIKMDLALNNLQRLICYKTQTSIQINKLSFMLFYNKKKKIVFKNVPFLLVSQKFCFKKCTISTRK